MNVALYGPSRSWWALTERTIAREARRPDGVTLGASTMRREGDELVVDIDEVTPWTTRRLRGRITLAVEEAPSATFALDAGGHHVWCPLAPSGAIDVRLTEPGVRFRGRGYHDANAGDRPLGATFQGWTWSRAHVGGRTLVTFDVRERDGFTRGRAMTIEHGTMVPLESLGTQPLPRSRWALRRTTRADAGSCPTISRSLEDGPFYARDVITTRIAGETVRAMHETLSVDRVQRRWVNVLLGFRMRRVRC
jgi:carotenoid 1,2-hydratase